MSFPSELCRRRSGMFAEVARLVPPGLGKQALRAPHQGVPGSPNLPGGHGQLRVGHQRADQEGQILHVYICMYICIYIYIYIYMCIHTYILLSLLLLL